MKVCVIQPPYSTDFSRSDEYFRWELDALERCDESMDLIVLPEGSDVPCHASTQEERELCASKYLPVLLEKAAQTARRCRAALFVNAYSFGAGGARNTTFAFRTDGEEAGRYYKQHLTPGEEGFLDKEYTYTYSEPTILEMDGVRYAFLTCYDFYFYENFANIARMRPDVIIGCSHQRSDTHEALMLINRFCAYNTNAYVVRASVSMGEDSPLGGCSCIVAPDGSVLADMESRTGLVTAEIDPHKKYYKPAGFGNPDAAHWEYIEQGRRPWKYRPAGSAIIRDDTQLPYPRICAHRGFNTIAPENTMPAFGAAIALGAQEIEFDLWPSKDGEIVSCHDGVLDRVSTGKGLIFEHTYEELLQYDFGVKFGGAFAGLSIVRFEDILQKFSGQVIMNVHIKTLSDAEASVFPFDEAGLKKIVALIRKYNCEKYVYFMSGNDMLLDELRRIAPDIARCAGSSATDRDFADFVDRALKYDCQKIQLFKPFFNQELIDRAHANGLRCTVFWADDPQEALMYVKMGIDTVLTNDYQRVAHAIREGMRAGTWIRPLPKGGESE